MQQSTSRTSQHIVKIDPEAVKTIFDQAQHQADALIEFYRLVFKERWDDIATMERWPSVSPNTWKDICRLAMDLDKRLHPNVVQGGLFMNQGPSTAEGLKDWQVDISTCEVTYKNELAGASMPSVPKEGG